MQFLKGVSKLMLDACRNPLDLMSQHLLAAIDAKNDSAKVKRGKKLADVLRRTPRTPVKLKLKLSFLTLKGTYEGIGAIYPPPTMGEECS